MDTWGPIMSSNGAASSGANVHQDTAANEPPPRYVSGVTVEPSDQNVPRVAKTVRGALSSGCLQCRLRSVPNLAQMRENDPTEFDDSLVEFHMQAALVDKTWIMSRCLREVLS